MCFRPVNYPRFTRSLKAAKTENYFFSRMENEELCFVFENNCNLIQYHKVNKFNMTVPTNERRRFAKQNNHNITWQ